MYPNQDTAMNKACWCNPKVHTDKNLLKMQNSSQGLQMYETMEQMLSLPSDAIPDMPNHSNTFLFNLSILKDKVQQVQSVVDSVIWTDQAQQEFVAIKMASVLTIIQEIIVTASSMMLICQKMAPAPVFNQSFKELHSDRVKVADDRSSQPCSEAMEVGKAFFCSETSDLLNHEEIDNKEEIEGGLNYGLRKNERLEDYSSVACDIVEVDAADLLAKYTHYCQICGKGFKREANLRMHMRAHGDEYKSSAALGNQLTKDYAVINSPRKYSCPQEGCRWNKKHSKFQPLKSMICVKNHYRRSHCPKMYVCSRCNQKQFSLLSDLRTHEKHCGNLRWQCSCGTTFCRKDKLMGHVALFIGHEPAMSCFPDRGKSDHLVQERAAPVHKASAYARSGKGAGHKVK